MNTEKALLRKYEDDLNISGIGVIIMGAWSCAKVFIEVLLNSDDVFGEQGGIKDLGPVGISIVLILVFILSIIIMKIHLYIGGNAMKASKGMQHKKGYFVAAIIYAVVNVLGLLPYYESLQNVDTIDTTIASILVDLTTIYILIIVIISTLKIKRIND